MATFRASALLARVRGAGILSDLQHPNIRNLTLDSFCQGFSAAAFGGFLTVFLVRLGASDNLVGLAVSLPALAGIVLTMPAGMLLERSGDIHRTTVWARRAMYFGYFLIALVPLAATGHAAAVVIVVVSVLAALPSAWSIPGWMAVIAEATPTIVRPRVNGLRWGLNAGVSAVAAAGFGWLLVRVDFPRNYQVVFLTGALASFVGVYIFSRVRLPSDARPRSAASSPLRAIADLARAFTQSQSFARFIVAAFVVRLGLNLPAALMPIFWVQHLHATDAVIGLVLTVINGGLVVGYFLWGHLAIRFGHRRVLLAGTLGYGLYPVLMSLVPSQLWMLPVAVVAGVFGSAIDVGFFETMVRTSPPDRRPSFLAVNYTSVNVAMFVAPLTGTVLAGLVGIRPVLALAGGICLLGLLLFIALPSARADRPVAAGGVG